jgi:ketosteroid isomerase-like protein
MRRFFLPLLVAAGLGLNPASRATPLQEEVRTADTARIMATIAGDVTRLAPLLADALTYGHADGRVQTKADFLAAVRSNRLQYEAYDYEELHIVRASDDVAIMTGRAKVRAAAGNNRIAFRLRFLAVWRREDGAWRLSAYQSAPLPESAGK